ncbi:hypothetical protein A0H81_00704 [Grifola frondosa]|uniref:Uncharacterized protein n=1 Tax=Grifola frondosa TaxID=5627 RepID=A0A1C7MSY7_GRIFR|nr:hypothetical protein A0H81_00704 [Grifola frondosa]
MSQRRWARRTSIAAFLIAKVRRDVFTPALSPAFTCTPADANLTTLVHFLMDSAPVEVEGLSSVEACILPHLVTRSKKLLYALNVKVPNLVLRLCAPNSEARRARRSTPYLICAVSHGYNDTRQTEIAEC